MRGGNVTDCSLTGRANSMCLAIVGWKIQNRLLWLKLWTPVFANIEIFVRRKWSQNLSCYLLANDVLPDVVNSMVAPSMKVLQKKNHFRLSDVYSTMSFGVILPWKNMRHFSPSKFDWECDVSGPVDKAEASVSFSWNFCSRCASLSRAIFCGLKNVSHCFLNGMYLIAKFSEIQSKFRYDDYY